MSNKITSLEADLQCLEAKKMELQHQLRVMDNSQQQGVLKFSPEMLNKLTSADQFGIFAPTKDHNVQLVVLKINIIF